MMEITAGTICTVDYPFIRAKFDSYGEDLESWRPGIAYRMRGPEEGAEAYANAMGKMVLTVVSIHKPGRFPTRVFFTRQFITPDGHVFGKQKCLAMTLGPFRARTRGFMHPFIIDADEREAA